MTEGGRRAGGGSGIEYSGKPVVFLDRDGVLNEEVGYIRHLDDLRLMPDAAEAVVRLNRLGIACIVVTNQSGPARGYYGEEHVRSLNARLADLLSSRGARLDAIYYCPHHAAGIVPEYAFACACRKPAPGMIEQAFREIAGIDRGRAYMIGDQATDIDLARNAGIRAVLVRTGYGAQVESGQFQWQVDPDFLADSLGAAVDWIVADLGMGGGQLARQEHRGQCPS